MYIYNEDKIKEVARALNFQGNFDDMCKHIFYEYTTNRSQFEFINEGSDRSAMLVKGTDIVVKIAINGSEIYRENSIDCQGAIEKMMYDEYKDETYVADFYGFSNNYCVIFMEKLDDPCNFTKIRNRDSDFVNFINENYYEKNDRDAIFIETYIYDYMQQQGYSYINDLHVTNVGIDSEGNLRILDLGYGDGYVEKNVIADIFEENIDYPIYGINSCNNEIIRKYYYKETHAHSQSSKRFY